MVPPMATTSIALLSSLLLITSSTDAFTTLTSDRSWLISTRLHKNHVRAARGTTPSSSSSSRLRSTTDAAAPASGGSNNAGADDVVQSGVMVTPESMITPEGYGFTSEAGRVLQSANRGTGYHRAAGSDLVIDVMAAVSSGEQDVALVFDENDDDKLLGLFTESDYIKFSTARGSAATSEEESAKFLVAAVRDYITPADELIAVAPTETANVVIAAMKHAAVRHIIVADKVSDDVSLLPDSTILGVISMQDIMSLIQKDERLSLTTMARKYPNVRDPLEQMRIQMIDDANAAANNPETAKQDVLKVGASALFVAALALFFSQSPWLHDHADLAMIGIFVMGYLGIIFEEVFEFNKAGVALLMSAGLWVTYADYYNSANGIASQEVLGQLGEQLAEVSDICFFLLAASTIVEVVDAHQGFKVVTDRINTTSKKELFWVLGFITFFLSAILNNLTVTIVMVSLLRKLIANPDDRKLFGAMVVVAANAGGVWTPIGDVTTTMLWINQQLSTVPTIVELFLPSVVCLVASMAFLVNQVEEDDSLALAAAAEQQQAAAAALPEAGGPVDPAAPSSPLSRRGQLVFAAGIASLLSVPVFAELTGLPPYLAMLTGLGVMWTLTDVIHMGEGADDELKVPVALSKLDTAGILFFFGILMSIGVLDKSGLLKELAEFLSNTLPSLDIIATVIGLASALIDNVPLVAATMGMYDLSDFGTDDKLWQLIALCAGTGGSILVIGSASGVALMGLEKIDFLWYAKRVSIGAAVGYFAGIATYLLQNAVLHGEVFLQASLPAAVAAVDAVQQSIGGTLV